MELEGGMIDEMEVQKIRATAQATELRNEINTHFKEAHTGAAAECEVTGIETGNETVTFIKCSVCAHEFGRAPAVFPTIFLKEIALKASQVTPEEEISRFYAVIGAHFAKEHPETTNYGTSFSHEKRNELTVIFEKCSICEQQLNISVIPKKILETLMRRDAQETAALKYTA